MKRYTEPQESEHKARIVAKFNELLDNVVSALVLGKLDLPGDPDMASQSQRQHFEALTGKVLTDTEYAHVAFLAGLIVGGMEAYTDISTSVMLKAIREIHNRKDIKKAACDPAKLN